MAQGLPLASATTFLVAKGFETEARYLELAPGTPPLMQRVKRGKALEILRANGLLDEFISECWPTGTTAIGKTKMDWYDRCYKKWSERGGDGEPIISDAEEIHIVERELQNYLAKNPGLLEAGLTLWPFTDDRSPIEYVVDDRGRRVDILGRDRSGIPVVIELKAWRGHERVIGQILYYKECVKQKLGAEFVRTIIVAPEISPEIRIAAKAISGLGLFEYKLAMTLNKI